jgi:hypothetical protein
MLITPVPKKFLILIFLSANFYLALPLLLIPLLALRLLTPLRYSAFSKLCFIKVIYKAFNGILIKRNGAT